MSQKMSQKICQVPGPWHKNSKLCPVLSTAYGLSISVTNDNIEKKPFRDIFKDRRGDKEDSQNKARSLGRDYGGFDYGDDWDAWK